MASNSNFNITKVIVDKISQEITGLEVNGKEVSLGEDFDVENLDFTSTSELPESTKLLTKEYDVTDESAEESATETYYIKVLYNEEEVGYIEIKIKYSVIS